MVTRFDDPRFLARYKGTLPAGDRSNPIIALQLDVDALVSPVWGHVARDGEGWTRLNVYERCSPNDSGGYRCTRLC
ncbi:MAG: hypothetical protein ACK4TB_03905 [Gemmobacter sp.]